MIICSVSKQTMGRGSSLSSSSGIFMTSGVGSPSRVDGPELRHAAGAQMLLKLETVDHHAGLEAPAHALSSLLRDEAPAFRASPASRTLRAAVAVS